MTAPLQLPAAPDGFVGRRGEIEALSRVFETSAGTRPAVVEIVGIAGVGKTALAVCWAQQVLDRFPDGQVYVDLRGDDAGQPMSADRVLDGLLRALGVPGAEVPAEMDAQVSRYRSLLAERRLLVVLDNAESADQVRPLLPGSPGSVAVVTSRSSLSGLSSGGAARRLRLDPLSPEEAAALLGQIIGTAHGGAEPEAMTDLARLCGFLPLALRIAAERVAARPDLKVADLVRDLGEQLGLFDVRGSDGDQVTAVGAAVSWSYRTLPAGAARAFWLLSRHPGPDVSEAAAIAVIGEAPDQVRGRLAVLTGARLLEEPVPGRYRFHDVVRSYAAERAGDQAPEDRAGADRRVLTWYLHSADAAVRVFSPLGLRVPMDPAECDPMAFADSQQALEWCEAERANLVAAVRKAARCGLHVIAWKLAAVLWDFFSLRGHWTDWIATHQVALASARQIHDRRGEAWIENNLGTAYRGSGHYEEALRHFEHALAICREIGHRPGEGWALYNLGDTCREVGRFPEALNHLRLALVISREIGEPWSEGYTLNMLGDIYRSQGDYDEALRHLMPALVTNRRIGHRRGEGHTLSMLGDTYRALGRYDRAVRHYEQALTVRRDIGDQRGVGATLHSLGDTHLKQSDPAGALRRYQEALAVRREIGDQRGQAQTKASLAALQEAAQES